MLDSAAHTPTRRGPIAEALIGVWTLRKYSDVTEGLPPQYPFGHDPEGLLIYTPDGCVSALLTALGRPSLSGSGFMDGTPEEYMLAGKRFIGYSGDLGSVYRGLRQHRQRRRMEAKCCRCGRFGS
jgi:Lipocalin-like domain